MQTNAPKGDKPLHQPDEPTYEYTCKGCGTDFTTSPHRVLYAGRPDVTMGGPEWKGRTNLCLDCYNGFLNNFLGGDE